MQTPGAYPSTFAAARPASVRSGPARSLLVRRAVTVAAGALADATIRSASLETRDGAGLRGGRWRRRDGVFTLRGVRFTRDSTVEGHGTFDIGDGATRGRLVVAVDGRRIAVSLAWDQRSARALARVGSTRLALPAP